MRITTRKRTEDREALLSEYQEARKDANRADARLKTAQRELLAWMAENEQKTIELDDGEKILRFTYVSNRRTVVDEVGLREALGDHVFDSYTKRVLDKPALEKGIDMGLVEASQVAPFVSYADTAPFVKYSITKKEQE